MREDGSYRVGIVGAGAIADLHLQALASLPEAQLVGVADLDRDRARRKADRFDVGVAVGTLAELLSEGRPDVVHVLTPPSTHAALTTEALEAGAHVYVEKPMASSEEECRAMEEAAASAGRELCVGHSMVHDPLFRRLEDSLAEGAVGELLTASFHLAFDPTRHPGHADDSHWTRSLPGGLLEDLAVHPASVLSRLLGPIDRAVRVPAADPATDAERTELTAAIQGERGLGVLSLSLRQRPADAVLDVRGTAGGARLNYSNRTLTLEPARAVSPKIERGLRNLHLAAQLATQTVTSTARFLMGRLDATGGVHTLIGTFYRALAAGEPAPVSPEEGRRAVRLLREVWQAPVETLQEVAS